MQIVLEPYSRKYGVEFMIIPELDFKDIKMCDDVKKNLTLMQLPYPLLWMGGGKYSGPHDSRREIRA